jgi:hypothetical protein
MESLLPFESCESAWESRIKGGGPRVLSRRDSGTEGAVEGVGRREGEAGERGRGPLRESQDCVIC